MDVYAKQKQHDGSLNKPVATPGERESGRDGGGTGDRTARTAVNYTSQVQGYIYSTEK